MSKYTTEVRWICESKSGFTEEELKTKTVDQIIAAARTQIFNFSWDSYNDTWKEAIEKFILKYYYTREIGLETVGLWQLKLSVRLDEIGQRIPELLDAVQQGLFDKAKKNLDEHCWPAYSLEEARSCRRSAAALSRPCGAASWTAS